MHHHYMPQSFLDAVRADSERYGSVVFTDPESGKTGFLPGASSVPAQGTREWNYAVVERGMNDIPLRLAEMEAMDLDMAALSISPALYQYHLDAAMGTEVTQMLNDAIHDAAKANPERFIAMGTVPLQDVGAAIQELERIVKDYGFSSIEIGGSVNGKNYDEPEFDAFFQRAAELDVLIFIHPVVMPAVERLQRYHTGNLIGFPVETGICAAALIFGGILKRYPNIKICLAHGGGIVPALIGRWDHGWEVRDEGKVAIDQPPSTYFKRLYFDDLVHSQDVLRALLNVAGADHVVIGTDYPYDMGERRPGDFLARQGLSPEDLRKIQYETAARLLRVEDRVTV